MIDIKKLGIISVIAILFGIFIFSLINAFYVQPDYSDFCREDIRPVKIGLEREAVECSNAPYSDSEADACYEQKGDYMPIYENGCIERYECSSCRNEFDDARQKYEFFVFLMSSIFGLVAVVLSIYFSDEKENLKEWILAGFLIGGLFVIFIGTGRYFSDLHRILRPIIILIEILLVILVAYRKFKK